MSTWHDICKESDLETDLPEAALFGTEQVAVVKAWNDQIYVVSNVDPRTKQGVMSRGIVGDKTIDGERRPTIASPIYKEAYDLENGTCYTNGDFRLPVYASRVEGGVVQVDLESASIEVTK